MQEGQYKKSFFQDPAAWRVRPLNLASQKQRVIEEQEFSLQLSLSLSSPSKKQAQQRLSGGVFPEIDKKTMLSDTEEKFNILFNSQGLKGFRDYLTEYLVSIFFYNIFKANYINFIGSNTINQSTIRQDYFSFSKMKKLNKAKDHLKTKIILSKQIAEFEKRLIISKKQIQRSSQAKRQIEDSNKIGVLYAVQALRDNNSYNTNLNNAKAQYNLLVRKYQSSVQGQYQSPLNSSQIAPKQNSNNQSYIEKQQKIKQSVEKLKFITARSFVVICLKTNQIIYGRRVNKQREMASLTKIMTLYICLRFIEKYAIVPSEYQVKISKKAVSYKGTSAGLRPNDTLSLLDLMYAMMLPSGNDAAYAIAECIGRLIEEESEERIITSSAAVRAFLDEMNRTAEELQLESTTYVNPHGLANSFNVSTAQSIATLVQTAMQNELFCTIVKTPSYKFKFFLFKKLKKMQNIQCKFQIISEGYLLGKYQQLNKSECLGVKTGYTPTAGPCFASIFEIPNNQRRVLLKTDNQDERFSEAVQLYEFVKQKFDKL